MEYTDKNLFKYGTNIESGAKVLINRKQMYPHWFIFGKDDRKKFTRSELCDISISTTDDMIIIDPYNTYKLTDMGSSIATVNPFTIGRYAINPLDIVKRPDTPEGESYVLDIKEETVISILTSMAGRDLTIDEKRGIDRAVTETYESVKDFVLDDVMARFRNNEKLTEEGKKLVEAYDSSKLTPYLNERTLMPDTRILIITFEGVPEKLHDICYTVCIQYIIDRLKQGQENRRYTWAYLDGIDKFLKGPVTGPLMVLSKMARKYWGILTFSADQMADVNRSQYGIALMQNSGGFCFFNQSEESFKCMKEHFHVPSDMQKYAFSKGDSDISLLCCEMNWIPLHHL